MDATKRIDFKEDINDLASAFSSLGYPTRIQIMDILLKKSNCTCDEISSILPFPQSTVSNHLSELKRANLIKAANSGKNTLYSIESNKLQLIKDFTISHLSNTVCQKIEEEKQEATPNKNAVKTCNPNRKPNLDLKRHNYVFPQKKLKEKQQSIQKTENTEAVRV